MIIKRSPSQASRPTSATESGCDKDSLKVSRGEFWGVGLGTALGQRLYLWQMLVFPLVPIVLLVIQNSYTIVLADRERQGAFTLDREVGNIVELSHLMAAVQQERTNLALKHLSLNDTSSNEERATTPLMKSPLLTQSLNQLGDYKNLTEFANINYLSNVNSQILARISRVIREHSGSPTIWRTMMAYRSIMLACEHLLLSGVLRLDSPPSENSAVQQEVAVAQHLFTLQLFYQPSYDFYHQYLEIFKPFKKRYIQSRNQGNQISFASVVDYMENVTEFVELLRQDQSQLVKNISDAVLETQDGSFKAQIVAIIFLLVILFVSVVIVVLVCHTTNVIQTYGNRLMHKTVLLRAEKRKSDCLLSQMLPLTVISQLKQHKQVVAENFDSVTVYFSDIVGFTRISARSSPMEVVMMLNSLYRLFDSQIQKYDVYKVETIGDSYMVVSGLPQKNGIMHASEIATMSLDLMYSLQHYQIPHQPQEKLEVRVGLNTGPCVAGVVGTTMPRYCLFGDTINTASRMESTGEAMKVHMTQETKEHLDQVGGFYMELRGQLEIKVIKNYYLMTIVSIIGKGFMNTYWLTGKENGISSNVEIEFNDECTFIPEFLQIITTSDEDLP